MKCVVCIQKYIFKYNAQNKVFCRGILVISPKGFTQ